MTTLSKFDINPSTGQILTKASLNHEDTDCGYVDNADPTACTYTLKVEVRDGLDEHGNEEEDDAPAEDTLDDVITVEIKVRDVNETPVAPKVTVTSPAVAIPMRNHRNARSNFGISPRTRGQPSMAMSWSAPEPE